MAIASPLTRVLRRTPVAGVAAITAAPTVIAIAYGSQNLQTAATFALLSGAAALAFAVDDPIEAVLNACPTTRTARRAWRGLLAGLVISISWTAVFLAARWADADLGPIRPLVPETVAAAAVALALASGAARRGTTTPGLASWVGALGLLAVASALTTFSDRLEWLPTVGRPDHALRWWVVAGSAAVLAAWWSRDPAAR